MSEDNKTTSNTSELEDLAKACTPLQFKTVNNIITGSYSGHAKAYFAAGGKAKSNSSGETVVSTMLRKVNVRAYYDALKKKVQIDSIITREESMVILSDMAKTTMSDIAEYIKPVRKVKGVPGVAGYWQMKALEDIKPEHLSSISAVKSGINGVEIKQHDQKQAIKQLSDMNGWNEPEQRIITHKSPVPVQLTEDMSLEEMAKVYEEKRKKVNGH